MSQNVFREESGHDGDDTCAPVTTLNVELLVAQTVHQVSEDNSGLGHAETGSYCGL